MAVSSFRQSLPRYSDDEREGTRPVDARSVHFECDYFYQMLVSQWGCCQTDSIWASLRTSFWLSKSGLSGVQTVDQVIGENDCISRSGNGQVYLRFGSRGFGDSGLQLEPRHSTYRRNQRGNRHTCLTNLDQGCYFQAHMRQIGPSGVEAPENRNSSGEF